MTKLADGLKKIVEGLLIAVDGYNKSIDDKIDSDQRLEILETEMIHMRKTTTELKKIMLDREEMRQ